MKRSDIKRIQRHLGEAGLYAGEIDGKRGPLTDIGVEAALNGRRSALPGDWATWPPKRKAVALLQLLCLERGLDAGPVDGFYGPQTQSAAEQYALLLDARTLPRSFGDIVPVRANPHDFPVETDAALREYYGPPCDVPLVNVPCPWELRLDWDLATRTQSIAIHERLAESLGEILEAAYLIYGLEGIRRYGLDRYGGSYNCRKKRGSSEAWSTHAWGIAIDWYPSANQQSWDTARASLAHPDLDPWWELWEREGWLSLGRSENRDWMHLQGAKR